ncbi:MAG: hypothetical protein K0Q50_1656 [Vampirovibrio sp.]|nr:hypothetical protein [Vampirovibrio sp.]
MLYFFASQVALESSPLPARQIWDDLLPVNFEIIPLVRKSVVVMELAFQSIISIALLIYTI